MKWVISLTVTLLFSACNSMKSWRPCELEEAQQFESYFVQDTSAHAFDMQITVRKQQFSGVLIHKQAEGTHRFTFLTKTGTQLFSMVIDDQSYAFHYIHKSLDKKIVKQQLIKDLRLLVYNHNDSPCIMYEDEDEIKYLWKVDPLVGSNKHRQLWLDAVSRAPLKYGVGKKRSLKYELQFITFDQGIPEKLRIEHDGFIHLQIDLKRIALSN